MTPRELRKAERARLRRNISAHLADFSIQYEALTFAMEAFGADFDLRRFKNAFNSPQNRETYRGVQAAERAAGRVQGYVGDLAKDGVRLAELPRDPEGGPGFHVGPAFKALREAGVIDGELCADLVDAQKGRSTIEHEYIRLPAGKVHETVALVHEIGPKFFASTAHGSSRTSTKRAAPATKSGEVKRTGDTLSSMCARRAAVAPVRISYYWRFS